jgi:hypothetical protein
MSLRRGDSGRHGSRCIVVGYQLGPQAGTPSQFRRFSTARVLMPPADMEPMRSVAARSLAASTSSASSGGSNPLDAHRDEHITRQLVGLGHDQDR